MTALVGRIHAYADDRKSSAIKSEEGVPCATPPSSIPLRQVPTLPSRQASTPRAPQRVPEHVSCRDLGRFVDGIDEAQLQAQSDEASASRRRKTHALHALGTKHGESSSLPPPPHASRHAARKANRMVFAPPLVFDTTPGAAQQHTPPPIPTGATTSRHMPPRTKPRLFGLEEAPVFYPTWEEFSDPLKYIEWTGRPDGGNGVAYGIAKIVPPPGWHMDFCIDQPTFRFRTRVQRLNELSAEGRVAQNYKEQLEQFHAQQGHGRVYIPQLCHRPLDLYALKRAVQACKPGSWSDVAHMLGYVVADTPKCTSVLESAYTRLVEPFEAFLARLREGSAEAHQTASAPQIDETCAVCANEATASASFVTCTECERRYHIKCVTPPLPHAPRGMWVCPTCLVNTGGDFGFDDGETHSLHSFWQRCHAFEQLWAKRAGWTDWDMLSLAEREDRVEAEFWRLVHSRDEQVDVEYGADVHSTTHGHASPTMECEPLNVYARSGWNLNNLPILPDSLLRYIRSEISGMTAPWIYIGMMFSAFCWHNEDHYTYSINYQHFGATKTWYGVPGADEAAFEAAMERIAPELFKACPDLLLQLVTMMSPALALREGVRMYACNQHPNEFVVTYPKAYHSGLNQGFNLNEAVNFALPDWVMDGLACVRRYQRHARQPVFSHDELLVSIALHNQQLSTATWLHPAFEDMLHRELHGRERIRELIRAAIPNVDDEPFDADIEIACAHCKTLCYLSHVVATKDGGKGSAACLAHAALVHGEDAAQWTLKVRHPDSFLTMHAARLAERAAAPVAWQQRVRRFLMQHPRPPLRTLRMLAQEGDKIPMALPEHKQLTQFLKRAEPWIAHARVFISKRQAKPERRPRSSRGSARERHMLSPAAEAPPADVDHSVSALLELHARAATLHFDAPELQQLDAVVDQMHTFRAQVATFLNRDPEGKDAIAHVDEAERVLSQGELLHVDVPEVAGLQQWIQHVRWFAEVHDIGTGFLTHDEVSELEQEADACNISRIHPMRQMLAARLERGAAWDAKALHILDAAPVITLDMLQGLLDAPFDAAISTDVHRRVDHLKQRATQWQESIREVFENTPPGSCGSAHGDEVPYLEDARHVLAEARAARVDIPHAEAIEAAVHLHDEWNAELAHILQLDGPDAVGNIRAFCDKTIRTANADAVNRDAGDAPTYAPIYSYPPVPYPPPRSTESPCICFEAQPERTPSVVCAQCYTVYHLRCLNRKAKPPRGWRCAFCDDAQLKGWIASRRAVSQLPLVALLQNARFAREHLRFVPANLARLQAAVRATVEFGVAVSMQFRAGRLPAELLDGHVPHVDSRTPQLKHMARRAFACPINVLLIGDSTPQHQHVPNVLDVFLPAFRIQPAKALASKAKRAANGAGPAVSAEAGPSRKRAKRARFAFREEALLATLPPDTYCLCHAPDNGTMVQCDRCTHWFHSACMGIDNPNLLQDKWFCPVCCFRQRTKYPFAEVKIRDTTRSVQDMPPDMFVDVIASLKSQTVPVLKRQSWMSSKRIVLHLSEFEPAIPASDAPPTQQQPPPAKRARVEHAEPLARPPPPPQPLRFPPSLAAAEEEEQRHRAGRMNLLRRGVSESMMHMYPMGWDGESIVCQITHDTHILFGPQIALAHDDPDGTRLLRMALDGLIPWATVVRPVLWAPSPHTENLEHAAPPASRAPISMQSPMSLTRMAQPPIPRAQAPPQQAAAAAAAPPHAVHPGTTMS